MAATASSNDAPTTLTGRALVCRDTLANDGWKIENVTTRPIKDDELLVEMVASGVCHTDILVGGMPPTPGFAHYPRVLGHEGSGYVRAVGSSVTVAKPGDAVLCSFDYCNKCVTCDAGTPSLCYSFNLLNFAERPAFAFADSPQNVDALPEMGGQFFGQSSFANFSIVSARSVVNATELVRNRQELELFAPLGCGIQTGSGTVINVAKAGPKDVVAVQGLGGVGLSAIMAAKIAGCRIVIGIDRVASRLEFAKELGATHVVNTAQLPAGKTVVEAMQEIADGAGPTITVETTGVPALIKSAVEACRLGGKVIQVGSAPPDFMLDIPAFTFMVAGKTYMGAIEGNSTPSVYVPQMIQWYREGKFPFDKLIKKMPAEAFKQALEEMHSGETVKPVLVW